MSRRHLHAVASPTPQASTAADGLYKALVKLDALADAIACLDDSREGDRMPPDPDTISNLAWIQRDLVKEALRLSQLTAAPAVAS